MLRSIRILFFTLFLSSAFTPLAAQDEDVLFRREIGGGFGMGLSSNDASIKYFDGIGFAGNAILRFNLNKRMAIKTTIGYNSMKGDLAKREDLVPGNPNLLRPTPGSYNFSSGVLDLNALYELHFLPYGYIQDYRGMKRLTPYIQFGVGMSYGICGKAFTTNLPIGFGLKWKVAKRLNIGLDWTINFTLSDKLDGLEAPLGIKSSMFKNKDHYSRMLITLTYDISPRCPNCQKDD